MDEPEDDGNLDMCVLCGIGGSLVCCDGCPGAFHMRCIGETAKSMPDGEWLCAECCMGGRGEQRCEATAASLLLHSLPMAASVTGSAAVMALHALQLPVISSGLRLPQASRQVHVLPSLLQAT